MNSKSTWKVVALGCVFLSLAGCAKALVPMFSHDSAKSLPQRQLQVDTVFSPMTSLSVGYGVTDKLDIGIDVESTPSLWTRYTLRQNPVGVSTALTAGFFTGKVKEYGGYSRNSSDEGNDSPPFDGTSSIKGVYAGGLYEYSSTDKLNFTLAYRLNYTNYDAFQLDGISRGLISFGPELYFNEYRQDPWDVSAKDFRFVGQVSAHITYLLRSHFRVNLGVVCHANHSERNRYIKAGVCGPIFGFSFNRR